MNLLGSFVPVKLSDRHPVPEVLERIRKVGKLLSTLKAPFLVMADDQSVQTECLFWTRLRQRLSHLERDTNGSMWGRIVADAEKVANEFGLDLVFHPHVSTYVETPQECESCLTRPRILILGLCLDTGHCVYGQGDRSRKRRNSRASFVSSM